MNYRLIDASDEFFDVAYEKASSARRRSER